MSPAAMRTATTICLRNAWPDPREDADPPGDHPRSEEHTSELQSPCQLVCRLLLEKKYRSEEADRPAWEGHSGYTYILFDHIGRLGSEPEKAARQLPCRQPHLEARCLDQ